MGTIRTGIVLLMTLTGTLLAGCSSQEEATVPEHLGSGELEGIFNGDNGSMGFKKVHLEDLLCRALPNEYPLAEEYSTNNYALASWALTPSTAGNDALNDTSTGHNHTELLKHLIEYAIPAGSYVHRSPMLGTLQEGIGVLDQEAYPYTQHDWTDKDYSGGGGGGPEYHVLKTQADMARLIEAVMPLTNNSGTSVPILIAGSTIDSSVVTGEAAPTPTPTTDIYKDWDDYDAGTTDDSLYEVEVGFIFERNGYTCNTNNSPATTRAGFSDDPKVVVCISQLLYDHLDQNCDISMAELGSEMIARGCSWGGTDCGHMTPYLSDNETICILDNVCEDGGGDVIQCADDYILSGGSTTKDYKMTYAMTRTSDWCDLWESLN